MQPVFRATAFRGRARERLAEPDSAMGPHPACDMATKAPPYVAVLSVGCPLTALQVISGPRRGGRPHGLQLPDFHRVLRAACSRCTRCRSVDHEEDQPAGRQLPVLRGVESAVRDPAVGIDGRRLVGGEETGRCGEAGGAARMDVAVGGGEPRHARLLQVRRLPDGEFPGADGRARQWPTSRPRSTSCCRSASRSIRSPRCPTRWTCICAAPSRPTTSSTTRCS